MNFLRILFFIIYWVNIYGHLLPEDGVTDNEEQLNREKRDNLFDSILKTIPFFNPTIEQDDPIDPNDDDDVVIVTPIDDTPVSSSVITTKTTTLLPLSASIFPSATTLAMNNTSMASSYISTNFTSSIQINSTINIKNTILPTFSINKTSSMLKSTPQINITSTSISKTTYLQSTTMMSLTYPSSKNIALLSPSATDIQPSTSKNTQPVSSTFQPQDTVINMMIMPGEAAVLPNEKGYGDSTAGEPIVDKDMKNIRYIYRNVLVPVMSGILGALLITFSVIIYKCIRRRKLQKIRYYGGKPNSSLYRLDHMSLLSDDSSDED